MKIQSFRCFSRALLVLGCRSIVVCLLTTVFSLQGAAEDWYCWRGPRMDGISTESDWTCDWSVGATVAWRADVGIGFSSVVTSGGLAFTIGHVDEQDVVTAVKIADGSIAWQFGYPAELDDRDFEGGPTSTPTVAGDRVYVLSRAGELFCLETNSGKLSWQVSLTEFADVRLPGWGCAAAPLVVGEVVLLNLGEAGAAVDASTGNLIWSSADRESGYATPYPVPGSDPPAVVIASGKSFVGVEIETGARLWAQRWLTSFNCNAADPIIHDGQLFLSSGYNRGSALFRLDEEGPQLIWKSKEMRNQIHSSIRYGEHLYGIDGDMETGARIRCLDWDTGKVRWTSDGFRPGGLSLAGDRLIVLSESGELIIAPAIPTEWKPTARAQVANGKCWTVPVMSNGRIYCRTIQGELVCVDCRS